MPNRNYQRGRAKEYRIKKRYEFFGYEVLRTAGSHGFADLIAIDRKKKVILFIQCKPKDFPEREEKKLLKKHGDLNSEFAVRFQVL